MFVAAALVPDTALLVPGASGGVDVVPDLRARTVDAVRAAVVGVSGVVVVAPARSDRVVEGSVRATLSAVGVPDRLLGRAVPEVRLGTAGGRGPMPAVATAVALHLLAEAGWTGPVRAWEVTADDVGTGRADVLAALGRQVVAGAEPTALVVVGSGSARHGPDAPLADDERAAGYDERLVAALGAGEVPGDPALAVELAVSGWAPWQVLRGAAGGVVEARVLDAPVVLGAQHVVAVWRAARATMNP